MPDVLTSRMIKLSKSRNGDLLPTRQSLLSRIRNWEDRDSWQEFYDTYWRLIYGVALKAGLTREEAEEALQETVIAVANEIREFKYDSSKGSFKAWLLQQTRWRIADQFRKRKREESRRIQKGDKTDLLEQLPDPVTADVSETLWDEEWHRNIFSVALERVKLEVNPRTYQLFQLYVLQEWPAEKVARLMRVSRVRVYVAKHRITARVEREMQQLARQAAKPAAEARGREEIA